MAAAKPPKPQLTAMDKSLQYLEGRYGKGIVMNLDGVVESKPCIKSGHPFVDYVLGGGFFFGKHHELFGYESSGKSTLAYQTAINCQKMKFKTGRVLLMDYEHSWSKTYFKRLGGVTTGDSLLVSQPDTAEDGLEVMREMIDEDLIDLIIVDSVSAMLPKAEEAIFVASKAPPKAGADGEEESNRQMGQMGTGRIGSQSLMMSQGLKQLSARIHAHKVCIIWINQIRTKIETAGNRGASDTTSGGNALRFYAAVRLELRKVGAIKGEIFDPFLNKKKEGVIAVKTIVKGAKNKEAPPFREAPITIRFGTGIDVEDGISEFAVNQGILPKGGAGWYMTKEIGATRNARGLEDFRALMKEEPQVWNSILSKCDFEKAMDSAIAVVVPDPIPEPVTDVAPTFTNLEPDKPMEPPASQAVSVPATGDARSAVESI